MKKLYAAMAAAGLAGLLALSAGAKYIGDDLPGFTEISVYPMQATEWKPDGIFTKGEYHKINYERGWVSAYADREEDAQAAKDLDFTIAMSWDDTYIYTYVKYVDTNGYANSYADVPQKMWMENMLQLNFANGDAGGEENMYSVEMTGYIDTGELATYSWYDYMDSGWMPVPLEDFGIRVSLDEEKSEYTVTYEARIPVSVFSDWAPANGSRYSFCPLISWGSEGAVMHTQLGSGSTNGKNIWNFVNFTLRDAAPNFVPESGDTYWAEAESAFQRLDLVVPYAETAWNPDGKMSDGEYFLIEEDVSWNSASVDDPVLLDTAKHLDYTLGMSWDKDYLYTYMEFIDPNGHVNEGTAEEIWNNGGLQIGLACGDRSGGGFLEYGVSRSTKDGSLMSHRWHANEGGEYDPAGNFNVLVTDLENGTSKVVYEVRTPHKAYTDWGINNDQVLSVAYVLCWGNNAVAHTQMASGISGDMGKDASCFADIILTGGPSTYIDEEDAGEVAFTVEQATAEWAADGTYTAGEYFDIDVENTWMSAFSHDPFLTENVKNLPFDLAMSWDEDYLYSYVKFTAPGGYVQTPAGDAGNMWGYTCLQVSAADVDCTGEDRLEYGLATDTDGDMISAVWGDYIGGFDPEGDYGVFVNGNTVVYEVRTPFTAFSDAAPTNGNKYGVNYVLSTSLNPDNLRHTQLASGCTGDPGKDASRFATITLHGDDIKRYTFDESTGTLTVTDAGALPGFASAAEQPWAEFRDQIKAIVIEGSVKSVGTNSFLDCVNAETITIGEGIEEIAIYAFENCAAVKTIHIPGSVTNISVGAFKRCYSLESFTVAAANTAYTVHENVLFNKDMTELLRYPLAKTGTFYYVPDSVEVLLDASMEGLQYLEEVFISNGVKAVKGWCFADSKALKRVYTDGTLDFLGSHAFAGCSSLYEASFHASMPKVWEDNVFGGTAENFVVAHNYYGIGWENMTEYPKVYYTISHDITGDGKATEEDVALLRDYFSGYSLPEKIRMIDIDFDADNKFTRRDVMIYARHVAHWDGYEYLPYTKS